jgi:nicotinate-nucleotide adenylyltransferase
MRLGILGGTFDPVHYGHLLLAEQTREQCRLDRIWFLPAAVPPHKQNAPLTPGPQRIEMLRLAIAGHEAFEVSTLEIDRGGVSYTLDTLLAVRQQQPDAELFLLMGADSLRDLPTWWEPARICQLATPIVVRRRGAPEPDLSVLASLVSGDRLAEIRRCQVEVPVGEFSSTAIRQAVLAGRSIRYQTPRAVETYIETQGLYRGDGS